MSASLKSICAYTQLWTGANIMSRVRSYFHPHLVLMLDNVDISNTTYVICVVQISGEAVYVDDVGISTRELFAAPVESTQALAKLGQVDPAPALKMPGVVAFVGKHYSALFLCWGRQSMQLSWPFCSFVAALNNTCSSLPWAIVLAYQRWLLLSGRQCSCKHGSLAAWQLQSAYQSFGKLMSC